MVACIILNGYIVGFFELIVDEPLYDGGFSSRLVAQKDDFVLDFIPNGHRRDTH